MKSDSRQYQMTLKMTWKKKKHGLDISASHVLLLFAACNKQMIDRGRHLHSPESRIDQTNIQALKTP